MIDDHRLSDVARSLERLAEAAETIGLASGPQIHITGAMDADEVRAIVREEIARAFTLTITDKRPAAPTSERIGCRRCPASTTDPEGNPSNLAPGWSAVTGSTGLCTVNRSQPGFSVQDEPCTGIICACRRNDQFDEPTRRAVAAAVANAILWPYGLASRRTVNDGTGAAWRADRVRRSGVSGAPDGVVRANPSAEGRLQ